MFIGRESELALLNNLYTSDKFEFVVMYGRRRVGKTALISEFIKDKKAIYFMGILILTELILQEDTVERGILKM